VGRAALEHRPRAVEPHGLARAEAAVQLPGERSGAATEIDDPHAGVRLHQAEQVEERLLALGAEALVLRGIPRVGHDGRLAAGARRRHARCSVPALQRPDVRDTRLRRE
jgi:hypothetical protein